MQKRTVEEVICKIIRDSHNSGSLFITLTPATLLAGDLKLNAEDLEYLASHIEQFYLRQSYIYISDMTFLSWKTIQDIIVSVTELLERALNT